MAHFQKISNVLSTSRQYCTKKCLQLTPKNVETRCCIVKTVWQRIPGRRARNSKTPTTKTVQAIARNDQLPLTGRPLMLTTSNVCHWCGGGSDGGLEWDLHYIWKMKMKMKMVVMILLLMVVIIVW